MQSKTIGFIGGGNMAESLVGGLVATGHDPDRILVADPSSERRDLLTKKHGIAALEDNIATAAQADILVMAVKPNVMAEVLRTLQATLAVRKPLLITIAAGLPMRLYRDILGPDIPLVRAMPNTPSLLRAGITGAVLDAAGRKDVKPLATSVLGAVGEVRWLDNDTQLDALSTVSGSGPAYFFYLMECMQAAAEKLGLDADLSRDLVLHTALGSAKLALHDAAPPAELRRRVTSPGGTTAEALAVMRAADLDVVMEKALKAAFKRAGEIASEA